MGTAYSLIADNLSDNIGTSPPLSNYVFVPTSGTATITGFFLNPRGSQEGPMVSYAFTVATTFANIYAQSSSAASTLPFEPYATGFVGTLSGASVYEGLGARHNANGTIAVIAGETPAAGYPIIAPTNALVFGRVSATTLSSYQGPTSVAPQTVSPSQGTLTDRSGAITTGGTAQVLMAANSTRRYILFQNTSIADLWINFTTTAAQTQPSFKIPANGSFGMENGFVSTEAISIIGATTGQAFTAKEG